MYNTSDLFDVHFNEVGFFTRSAVANWLDINVELLKPL